MNHSPWKAGMSVARLAEMTRGEWRGRDIKTGKGVRSRLLLFVLRETKRELLKIRLPGRQACDSVASYWCYAAGTRHEYLKSLLTFVRKPFFGHLLAIRFCQVGICSVYLLFRIGQSVASRG